jgi:hypothetical protein
LQERVKILLGLDGEEALNFAGKVLINSFQIVQRLADIVDNYDELA